MGKHTAADDSTVHPLVADALARRAAASASADGGHGGSTGWPEPEREGGGAVGWPDDTVPGPDRDARTPDGGPVDGSPALLGRTAPIGSRRGWRRLFGASPAA